MGEYAESAIERYNSKLQFGEDMSVAGDIARRFEQLESQWQHFQKKSANWELENSSRSTSKGAPSSRLQGHIVPSKAFSYSNPLFTSHKSFKKKSAGNSPRASLASARNSLTLVTSFSPDRILSSRQKPPLLYSSERHCVIHKDDNFIHKALPIVHTGSSSSPGSSISSKTTGSSREKCLDSIEGPNVNSVPTPTSSSYPADKTSSYSSSLNNESLCRPSSSSSPVSAVNSDIKVRNPFIEVSTEGTNQCSDFICQSKLPIGEYTRTLWASPLSSPKSSTNSKLSTQDPASYSSGKGPPGLQVLRMTEELGSTEVAHSSRSPPPVTPSASSARETEQHSDSSTMERLVNLKSKESRNHQLWKNPMERRPLFTEGALKNSLYPPQVITEEGQCPSDRSTGPGVMECVPLLTVKTCKPDDQVDWKDRTEVSELVQKKLDHTISKVEWELRLSKRESKLRIAEEALLEEQQKLSEARLAISKCEAVLTQREDAVKELEKIRDLETSREYLETGAAVIGKLVTALRDVLAEMEHKEKGLRKTWSDFKQSLDTDPANESLRIAFEPELSKAVVSEAGLEGIHLLATDGNSNDWCKIVISVCERLTAFLAHETHLQKWAIVMERESRRLKTLEEEILNTKEATAEHFERAAEMMRCAEEQCRIAEEERLTLNKERESLVLWVNHLQERRKAVTECEREAASSLADVQKKAADLFVHESSIDGKALEISAMQEELWATSMRLQEDQELVNKERMKVQDRLRQVASRERDAESQLQLVQKLKEELEAQRDQFGREKKGEEKKRERAQIALQELEDKLNARELKLRNIEKELEEKSLAADSLAGQLNEREKILKSMHDHCEHERLKAKELIADLEREKRKVKDSEEAVGEAQVSKKNADEAWARVAKERREADEYLKSVEERVKAWEDRLRVKERELQQQQISLREIESRIQEEQDRSQTLHSKLIEEQETWNEELNAKQESLAKRTKILESKEAEIKSDLEKLTEERRLAINEIKRFAEIEARAWTAERELQTKHDEHLQSVRKNANDYRAQIEELEAARREVESGFEEVQTKRDDLQTWQREAEETLQSRIDSFVKGKEELQMQIQDLKKLQLDIEQAGAQIIDRVAELDQASSKLDGQRSKVELSKMKLEGLARNLAQQQELVKEREKALNSKEEKIALSSTDMKRLTAEIAAQEKNLRFREQAVIDSENDLKELEARLANERKDLEKMIAEVEQHAATLKEETASAEENSRNRSREELMVEEKRQRLFVKEKELTTFEAELKSKALSLEEHSQVLAKLEQQVQERLHQAQDVDKGWEKLREEQAAFDSERQTIALLKEESQQWKAEQDRQAREDAQRKARLREELDRQKTEMLAKLRERETAVQMREARISERESSILVLERQGKDQVQKDAQELRQQLNGARAELDSQRQYVEEKRRAAEAIAATIEDREAKLKAREKEVQRLEKSLRERERNIISLSVEQRDALSHIPADIPTNALDYRKMQDVEERQEARITCKEKTFQDGCLYRMATFDLMDNKQATIFKQPSAGEEERQNMLKKQEEELSKERLKQMEEALQKEASKILEERTNLKAQQKELEETRKAVQDVKATLTAQLKATKQMVADAALTAQNASREREALEEERRRLEKAQQEAETSLAAKEARLIQETKQLESMKILLREEKTQAMEVLQKASRVVEKERMKSIEPNVIQKEKTMESESNEREEEFSKTSEALQREKLNLQEEKARLKMLQEVLERGKHEQSHIAFQQAVAAEGEKEAESRMWDGVTKWRDQKKLNEAYNHHHHSDMITRDTRKEVADELSTLPYREALENQSFGTSSETSSRTVFNYKHSPVDRIGQNGTNATNTSWDETFGGSLLLSSPGSNRGAKVNEITARKRSGDSGDHLHEDNVPSKNRLENVMTSLINARQASRSRLQRTENALLGFPPSSPFTSQVQHALNALSARLSLMEQIEDGLASHLRKAYEIEYPESEGVIVDKVQLLCRMEEQQSLRAEWEEDMQQQLETISMLQAASRNASSFTTPVRATTSDKFQSSLHKSEGSGVNGQQGYPYGPPKNPGKPGIRTTHNYSNGPDTAQNYRFPEWKTTFEPLLGVDSKGLLFSPLIDYTYYPKSGQNSHSEYVGRDHDGNDKFARRKLHLSPSTNGH